jgi:hypothetical protein
MISGIKNEVGKYKEKLYQFSKIVMPYVRKYDAYITFGIGAALNIGGLSYMRTDHPAGAIPLGIGTLMMYGITLREQLKGNQKRASQKPSLADYPVAIEFAESLRGIPTEKAHTDA